MSAWYGLKREILVVFVIGVFIIAIVVFRLTGTIVERLKESDHKRESALREMQHSHKLSSIGRLATGVAHEINNPLSIINEKIGLMKDLYQYRPDLPNIKEIFLKHLVIVQQAVDRCSSITHRLLGFARRMDVHIEALDVNEVVEEVLGFLEREAKYRNITMDKNLAQDLVRISSDRGQLQQVFLNIINNSLAAVSDGGRIAIATSNGHFQTVAITIKDNGSGMSESTLTQMFEPFFTTKKGQGTGLGLSITHGIVKRLGGDIQVKSQLGKGTSVTIYLPEYPPEISESENGHE
jgi:two-component system NtrC family sensor kinase